MLEFKGEVDMHGGMLHLLAHLWRQSRRFWPLFSRAVYASGHFNTELLSVHAAENTTSICSSAHVCTLFLFCTMHRLKYRHRLCCGFCCAFAFKQKSFCRRIMKCSFKLLPYFNLMITAYWHNLHYDSHVFYIYIYIMSYIYNIYYLYYFVLNLIFNTMQSGHLQKTRYSTSVMMCKRHINWKRDLRPKTQLGFEKQGVFMTACTQPL